MTETTPHNEHIERALVAERERLRITLASIGDAVISTDAEGRVAYMNGVAESLTGWSNADAKGRPLPEVFHIVNEVTRQPVDNPALRALAEGRVVGLANHTVLIARDGAELPIDDSAAPMRDAAGALIGAVLVFRDVTERKRAEAARAQLAAIVDESADAIVSKTLDGIVRSWNAGAARLFGYTWDEVVGKNITLLIPPDRLQEETTILERLRRGERIDHFETVRVAKDGRLLELSLSVSPVKDHEGNVVGAAKIARDIGDRKRAEAALRRSEARHRFLVDLAAATQASTDPNDVMAVTARLLAEHLDVDRCAYAEIEDENTFVIVGDHSRGVPSITGRWPIAAFGAECVRCMLANEPYVIADVETDPRAGTNLDAYRQTTSQAVICVPLHKRGKLVAAMAVHRKTSRAWTDAEVELVTDVIGRSWESIERARVTRGLRDTAEHLALALRAASLGDWSWDVASDLVTLSPRAAAIFGIAPGPVLQWTALQQLIHDEDRERTRLAVERAVAAREQYDTEYRVVRPDGQMAWVSAKGLAQYDANGKAVGMYGVVQDISEKKSLEQQLRQRAEELAEADRKKDEFIAMLAHELRNPLAPVRTGLQVLMLAGNDAAAAAKARETMDRQLAHMVRLIDDLLDASRIGRNKLNLQKTRVLLGEVVSHAVEAVGPAIEAARHELRVSLPVEAIPLDADLTRLAQVFGNLLSNSAKYTKRGGHIALSASVQGDTAVVAVTDDGIGIPAEALPGVFEMFSQVDRSLERTTGGLGIGLALVKGLVEAHGGTVTAESPGPGKGSTFTVRLPIARRERPRSNPPLRAPSLLGAKRRVLVADDNEDGALTMSELLTLLGHEVHVASDGVKAVEMAEALRPDVILMDMGMPRLSGLDATKQIRQQAWGRAMTIVALTGWGQPGDRERSVAAGCDAHLVKPVSMPDVQRILAELPRAQGT